MTGQTSLFEETKKEEKEAIDQTVTCSGYQKFRNKKDTMIRYSEWDDDNEEVAKFRKRCREKGANWLMVFIGYHKQENKNGPERGESVDTSMEIVREFKDEDDSYGGMWGGVGGLRRGQWLDEKGKLVQEEISREEALEFIEEVLDAKRSHCKENGYVRRGADGVLTDVHWNDMALVITPKAREFLSKFGDVDKLITAWNKIEGRLATEEEIEAVNLVKRWKEEKEQLEKQNREIDKVLRERCHLKPEAVYIERAIKTIGNAKWFDMALEKLVLEVERRKKRENDLEEKLDEQYRIFRERRFDYGSLK